MVVPARIPPTTPLDEPTVAVAVALLLHVPPPGSVRVIVAPVHTDVGPDIEGNVELTVTM